MSVAMFRDDTTPAPTGWHVERCERPCGAWWICDACGHPAGFHGLTGYEGCAHGGKVGGCGCSALLPPGHPPNPPATEGEER